jgi:hypothetical protein
MIPGELKPAVPGNGEPELPQYQQILKGIRLRVIPAEVNLPALRIDGEMETPDGLSIIE